MHADAMDSSQVFQRRLACLGVPSRFRIVQRLAEARLCVSELAGNVSLSQSCTTRHLQALTAAGLVRPERAGKRVLYVLREDDADVARLLEWIRQPGAMAPAPIRRRTPGRQPGLNGGSGISRMGNVAGTIHREASPAYAAPSSGPPSGDSPETDSTPSPMHRDEMEDFLL
jgi:DNA-binding transcriptional ArsR family regulator